MSRLIIPPALLLACLLGPAAAQPTGSGTITQENRGETDLSRRVGPLLPSLRAALTGNNVESQRAALAVIESIPPGALFAADLAGPLRAYLSKDIADPALLALGLRALGKSLPNGKDISDIMGKHVRSESGEVRVAAAEAINNAIQVAAAGRRAESAALLGELLQAAEPSLEVILTTGDSASRRPALAAIRAAAARFGEVYSLDTGPGPNLRLMASELGSLTPRLAAPDWEDSDTLSTLRRLADHLSALRVWAASGRLVEVGIRSLIELGPALASPLADPDAETRMAALRTVASLGKLRQAARPATAAGTGTPAEERLRDLVSLLGSRLKDVDPVVRLAAASGLEYLNDLPGATDLLLGAVADRTVAVRWTVARALRPVAGSKRAAGPAEIEALARLATDPDLDIRNAALVSLERHGPAGAAATEAVLRSAQQGDVEPRLAAIRTLAALKSDASTTVPILVSGLRQDDLRLRRASASGLVRFQTNARPALPELRLALQSDDPELRIAAAEAVLAIGRRSD